MKPTQNLAAAIVRLRRAAENDALMSVGDFNYNGSISRDITAVLNAIDRATTVTRDEMFDRR